MLTSKIFKGAGWLVSSRLTGRGIDFVTLLILARALNPADFGLTALAGSLIWIVDMVFEIPLSQALTRLKSIRAAHLDTAFTLALLRSLALSAVLLTAAWPFSAFYGDPRLAPLICILAIGPTIRALNSPAMVQSIRRLAFHQIFVIEATGKVVAFAAALLVVVLGGGYWAIAANNIVAPIVTTLVSYRLAPYRPRFGLATRTDFLGFLGWFSAAQLIAALNWQFDRILLGHFVSRSLLGQYTMASDLATLPTQSLIGPAMQPVMAGFSTITDDPQRIQRAFLKACMLTMLITMPVGVGTAVTADMLVQLLLGDKWIEAAGFLRILPLTIIPSAYYQVLYSLALGLNRPEVLFRMNVIELSIRVVLVPIGFMLDGVFGVIAARGCIAVVMFAVATLAARRLTGIGLREQLGNLRGVALACACMGLAVLALRSLLSGYRLNNTAELFGTSSFGAIVYGLLICALGYRAILAPLLPMRGRS